MNIQFVRLDLDVCEPINRMAHDSRRTVSTLVNEALREYLKSHAGNQVQPGEEAAASN